jgi:hypothetical protein
MATRNSFEALSDEQLVAETKRLAGEERLATAALIRSLMELEARRLYLAEGCASLFRYCTEVLHLSEDAAYNRVEVARAARRFPTVLDALEDGRLTLTAARRLAPHLTDANYADAMAAAAFKSKPQIEELIAALNPQPDVASMIRRLPDPVRDQSATHLLAAVEEVPSSPAHSSRTVTAPAARSEVKPLAPERFKIQFTIGRETREKLRTAQDLLRHSVRNGDLAEIFDRALTLLLQDARRRQFAETEKPRSGRTLSPGSRTIPAAIKRAVMKRDQHRCTFVGANGRCTETTLLQLHHEVPFAVGGPPTVDNIHLRCAAHNRYEAELFFGVHYPGIVREARPGWPAGEVVPERHASACAGILHSRRWPVD